MKVLIVDDEPPARARLRSLIEEMGGDLAVVGEASNGMEALRRYNELDPDMLLLDIRMPGMDGLETARHLAVLNHPPAVIFTTAYGDHALAAFETQAVDYLLKPIRKARLEQALHKASALNRTQLQAVSHASVSPDTAGRARTHLSSQRQDKIRLIPISDILCLHADQKYVTVYHSNGEDLIEESLQSLEEEFGARFIRIHRNALISAAHLIGMEKSPDGHYEAVLRGLDPHFPISRSHLTALRKRLK